MAIMALVALAQESRLRVFRLLVRRGQGGACAGEIAGLLDVPATTLSFHLKTLCAADLCEAERDGRRIVYRARFSTVNGLIDYLTENCCEGQAAKPRECL